MTSSAIGAFSFLLFQIDELLKSPKLLVWGDMFLLATIVICLWTYLCNLQTDFTGFWEMYYLGFESFNKRIELHQSKLREEISDADYLLSISQFRKEIPEYKRPSKPKFVMEGLITLVFTIALGLIACAFFVTV